MFDQLVVALLTSKLMLLETFCLQKSCLTFSLFVCLFMGWFKSIDQHVCFGYFVFLSSYRIFSIYLYVIICYTHILRFFFNDDPFHMLNILDNSKLVAL